MVKLDPSGWLFLVVPYLVAVSYVSYRGLARNEFRRSGRSGWTRYRRGSFDWWEATAVNLLFLGCGLVVLWPALFDGANFNREPARPMPATTGSLVERAHVDRTPEALLDCLTKGRPGQVYADGPGRWVVAVRNGKGSVMYTYEVEAEAGGSRLDVRRRQPSPFVSWRACLRPS